MISSMFSTVARADMLLAPQPERARALGAVAGGVVGAVFGEPFWGPPISHGACWIDSYFRRHCAWHHRYRR